MFKSICFIGTGSWGQALAITLAKSGIKSSILVSDEKRMILLNKNKSSCFKDLKFPNHIDAFQNKQNLKNYDLIFITTESFRVKKTLNSWFYRN